MKITKYEHACFTVEKDGKLLVIDPGAFTSNLGAPENVIGIVVTHEHADHFDTDAIGALAAHNPDLIVIAHESITTKLGDTIKHQSVVASEELSIGPFLLKFYGGEHAVIHRSMPAIPNLGVMIDERVYYPGDSFACPDVSVDTLALPVSAPWCKISEVMDFLYAIKPRLAFPTHDAILSDQGKNLVDTMLTSTAQEYGGGYRRFSELEV